MTDKDITKTAALLKQLQPGFLPYEIFVQMARLSVLLVKEELNGTKLSKPQYVESLFRDTVRGKENVQVFQAKILSEPRAGSLFDLDDLPENFLDSQLDFIQHAANSFSS